MGETRLATYLITEGTFFVSWKGPLDGTSITSVVADLNRILDQGAEEIVVELKDVPSFDAAALEELAATGRRASCLGSRITLACEDETVLWCLGIVGLRIDFELSPAVGDAFTAVATRRARQALAA